MAAKEEPAAAAPLPTEEDGLVLAVLRAVEEIAALRQSAADATRQGLVDIMRAKVAGRRHSFGTLFVPPEFEAEPSCRVTK